MQNSGGCFTPPPGYFQRVREICDKHGVLLVSDEVICAFGRLGEWFGSYRYSFQPDMITIAKGLTSGYAPLGALIASDRIIEPFLKPKASFLHGITFAGHPVSCAVALANLDVFERDDILGHVRSNEAAFKASLDSLLKLPIVGDIRGAGYFWAIELVKDQATRESFNDEESEKLAPRFPLPCTLRRRTICRADDRGDPVIQLSPPLICGEEQFAEMTQILEVVLTEAWRAERCESHPPDSKVRCGGTRSTHPCHGTAGARRRHRCRRRDRRSRLHRALDRPLPRRSDPHLRIAVIESSVAGFGASGRNGGWCSALFATSYTARSRAENGSDAARRMQAVMIATRRRGER